MSFGHDFNPFVPPFAAKREIRVRETELIHTLTQMCQGFGLADLAIEAGLARFGCDSAFLSNRI